MSEVEGHVTEIRTDVKSCRRNRDVKVGLDERDDSDIHAAE